MAKTKPIGVRFDEAIFEEIKKEQGLETAQRVLNWCMNNYSATKYGLQMLNTSPISSKIEPKYTVTTTSDRGKMPKGLTLDQQIQWKIDNQ